MIFTDGFQQLCTLLGVPPRAAEDALTSERLAQHVVGRRGFLVGGLALLSTGAVSTLPLQRELGTFVVHIITKKGLNVREGFTVDLMQDSVETPLLSGSLLISGITDIRDSLGRSLLINEDCWWHKVCRKTGQTSLKLVRRNGLWSDARRTLCEH